MQFLASVLFSFSLVGSILSLKGTILAASVFDARGAVVANDQASNPRHWPCTNRAQRTRYAASIRLLIYSGAADNAQRAISCTGTLFKPFRNSTKIYLLTAGHCVASGVSRLYGEFAPDLSRPLPPDEPEGVRAAAFTHSCQSVVGNEPPAPGDVLVETMRFLRNQVPRPATAALDIPWRPLWASQPLPNEIAFGSFEGDLAIGEINPALSRFLLRLEQRSEMVIPILAERDDFTQYTDHTLTSVSFPEGSRWARVSVFQGFNGVTADPNVPTTTFAYGFWNTLPGSSGAAILTPNMKILGISVAHRLPEIGGPSSFAQLVIGLSDCFSRRTSAFTPEVFGCRLARGPGSYMADLLRFISEPTQFSFSARIALCERAIAFGELTACASILAESSTILSEPVNQRSLNTFVEYLRNHLSHRPFRMFIPVASALVSNMTPSLPQMFCSLGLLEQCSRNSMLVGSANR